MLRRVSAPDAGPSAEARSTVGAANAGTPIAATVSIRRRVMVCIFCLLMPAIVLERVSFTFRAFQPGKVNSNAAYKVVIIVSLCNIDLPVLEATQ